LVLGATHGDEPESQWLVDQWMHHWDEITSDGEGVVAIPCLNPDGLALNTRQNANKVDLNRNFPTANWGQASDAAEKVLGHPYYGGSRAGSELETQWLIQLLETYHPKAILSVHTPYKVVNWDGPPQAQLLADVVGAVTGYPVTHDIGYPTPGSFGTYVGIERHIPVITLELPEDSPDVLWAANKDVPKACLQWVETNG
jgi:protein MpaA